MSQKNFAWLAALGTVLSLSATQVNAQTITEDSGGNDLPTRITSQGFIEEFIQFTFIDSNLEMGDMGGPQAFTTSDPTERTSTNQNANNNGTANNGNNKVAVTLNSGENGSASAEWDANVYIRVSITGYRLRNAGVDGNLSSFTTAAGLGDDVVLGTRYARALKGSRIIREGGSNVTPQTPGSYGSYAYSGSTLNGNKLLDTTYNPGLNNGLKLKASVVRNGLNDLHGDYKGQVNMSYYKF